MEGPGSSRPSRPPFGPAVAGALVLGVLAASRLPVLPPVAWLALPLAMGAWGWARCGDWRRVAGALLVGAALFSLHAAWTLSRQLPPDMERGDFALSGRVVQLPEHEMRRTRFVLRVDRDAAIPAPLHGRLLRLSWYDDRGASQSQRFEVEAGSRWRFTVRLRAPRGLRNPGRSDSEMRMLAARIAATGYVRDREPVQRLSGGAGIDGWRERTAERIEAGVAGPSARFVRALALGDTRGLGDVDWEILRATGLTHLVAISGFHVGLVAGFAALACAGLWWLLPALGRGVPRPQAAAVGALLGAAGYAAVAGFALPTVRTVLMVAMVVLARLWRRPMGVADSLALPHLLHGKETRVWGDQTYRGQGDAMRKKAPKARDFTNQRYRFGRRIDEEEKARNRTKSRVRSKVEHAFWIIKGIFKFTKVRYRGLAKNLRRLQVTCALATIYMVTRRLLWAMR